MRVMSINKKELIMSSCLLTSLVVEVLNPFDANFPICIPFFSDG